MKLPIIVVLLSLISLCYSYNYPLIRTTDEIYSQILLDDIVLYNTQKIISMKTGCYNVKLHISGPSNYSLFIASNNSINNIYNLSNDEKVDINLRVDTNSDMWLFLDNNNATITYLNYEKINCNNVEINEFDYIDYLLIITFVYFSIKMINYFI